MRRAIYRGDEADGRALLARAPLVHLALVSAAGKPMLRTVNAVVVDGFLAFHGAPAGEKMEGVGGPVVVQAEEEIVTIPSTFIDPLYACPATTYYLSAQAHGVLEQLHEPATKARVLQALMEKYQPEGGHIPITHEHPHYAKQVRGILIAGVALREVDCKHKLGQNRKPEERTRIVEQLWRRGGAGDVRAASLMTRHFADLPRPAFLPEPREDGVTFDFYLEGEALDEAAALIGGAYWLEGTDPALVRRSLGAPSVCVGARDRDGALVGFARALSDGRVAWVYDVFVAPAWRSHGIGRALTKLLLDHPAVREVENVEFSRHINRRACTAPKHTSA